MSEREAYVPPVRQPEDGGNINNNTPNGTSTANAGLPYPQQPAGRSRLITGRQEYDTPDNRVYYICAACNATFGFKANEALRCLDCGGLTMFKPRVKQTLQYSAN